MTQVLHYVQQWLPPTEGFVAAQIAASALPSVVVSRHRPLATAARPARLLSLRGGGSDAAASLVLPALATALRAGVVHVQFGYRLRDARRLLGRWPVVVSLFGHDVTGFRRGWPRYYDGVLERVQAVVVPSAFLADAALAAGARADRLVVVPPGVDTAWFSPTPLPDGPPEVAFVGRFVEKKGLDVLLAAWPLVRRRVPGARLRLLGSGPLEPVARGTAAQDVQVVDGTGRAAVREALRRATVVCTPSRTAADGDAESLLLVNLEAQACGRPVVTTRHGGIPEFVDDGRSALVVPEGDAAALADALVALLADRALRDRLAAAGPAVAARFEVRACAARIDDEVYRPLLLRG